MTRREAFTCGLVFMATAALLVLEVFSRSATITWAVISLGCVVLILVRQHPLRPLTEVACGSLPFVTWALLFAPSFALAHANVPDIDLAVAWLIGRNILASVARVVQGGVLIMMAAGLPKERRVARALADYLFLASLATACFGLLSAPYHQAARTWHADLEMWFILTVEQVASIVIVVGHATFCFLAFRYTFLRTAGRAINRVSDSPAEAV